tara:strand:- start:382 stop:1605 length:1224 start_codon:yes stop_codon:yes gene_type:complete
MSYRDPQQAIDQRYSVISQGLSNLYKTVGSSMTNWKKIRQKRQQELDKRLTAQMQPIETEFNRILDDTRAFTGELSDRQDAETIQAQVQSNLYITRKTLARDLSNPDLTKDQITTYTQAALTDMDNLSKAIITMGLADDELVTGKTLSGRNDDLAILIKELSQDGENLKFYNEAYRKSLSEGKEYQNGNSVYYLANIGRDDVITVNMKDIGNQQRENPDSTLFIQNENPLDTESKYHKNWEEFSKTITTKGTKAKPGLMVREEFMEGDKLNVDRLKDYLTNDPSGQNLVNELFGGIDERGYLRSKTSENITDWTEYDQNSNVQGVLVDHLVEDALIDTQFPSNNIFRETVGNEGGETRTSTTGVTDTLGILTVQGGASAAMEPGEVTTEETINLTLTPEQLDKFKIK